MAADAPEAGDAATGGPGDRPGAFVVSLDFELHWGMRDHVARTSATYAGLVRARQVVATLAPHFADRGIRATWATVGMLFASSASELDAHLPARRPAYRRPALDPYTEAVGASEEDDPQHLAGSLVRLLADTPGQEIGSHTFSHFYCLEEGQSDDDLRADLAAARSIAAAGGYRLTSLVFPRNQWNPRYAPAVIDNGFSCIRGPQPTFGHDARPQGSHGALARAARLADTYAGLTPPPTTAWDAVRRPDGLCDVPASAFLRPYQPSRRHLEPLRHHRLVAGLRDAARGGRLFHLWWHPHNFAAHPDENLAVLDRLLDEFDRLSTTEGMCSLSMGDVADRAGATGTADADPVDRVFVDRVFVDRVFGDRVFGDIAWTGRAMTARTGRRSGRRRGHLGFPRGRGLLVVGLLAAGLVVVPGPGSTGFPVASGAGDTAVVGADTPGTTVPGTDCPAFPADNVWNTPVTGLPVAADSAQWLASMDSATTMLHPDYGPSKRKTKPYGIPWQIVPDGQPFVPVKFVYASESDPGPYPLAKTTPVEKGGDRHALMVDPATCTLFETWHTHFKANGKSKAGSGAVWNLDSDALRPAGWTSADAAGLPILPGLVNYDEVASGAMDHAIRVTAECTQQSYLWPARHQAGQADTSCPPMGARFRLDASFSLPASVCDTMCQTVVTTMQTYGLIVADNGGNWFFQGTVDSRWTATDIAQLKQVPARDFQAVDESCLMVSPDSGQALQPGTTAYAASCGT